MDKQKNNYFKITIHPVIKKSLHILSQLDSNTATDSSTNYKKLYYRAFNGLTDILACFEPSSTTAPILDRITEIQQELEMHYIEEKES